MDPITMQEDLQEDLYPEGYPDELIPDRCFTQDRETYENYPDIVYYNNPEEDEEDELQD